MISKAVNLLNLNSEEKKKCIESLKKTCENCQLCELGKTRNMVVFGSGNPDAKIMLIGEAPGADEDMSGLPFVGRAGKFLSEIITKSGLNRDDDIYITNTVKCRPPENRVPTDIEKKLCEDYLFAQIAIVNPAVIILCGATACQTFFHKNFWKNNKISDIRGQFFESQGIQFIPIFHPSYLLRQHSEDEYAPRNLTLKDFINIKNYVEKL